MPDKIRRWTTQIIAMACLSSGVAVGFVTSQVLADPVEPVDLVAGAVNSCVTAIKGSATAARRAP